MWKEELQDFINYETSTSINIRYCGNVCILLCETIKRKWKRPSIVISAKVVAIVLLDTEQ